MLLDKFKKMSLNDRVIIKNTLYSFLVKGGGLAISFLSAPAFVQYFGGDKQILGLWFTMLSVLTWFVNFDLGIGNGIRNHLVRALAYNDREESRKIISSGIFSVGVITVLLTFFGIVILFNIDLNWLFNIDVSVVSSQTLLFSSIIVLFGMMLSFFLTTIRSIYYSLHKSAVNSFLGFCAAALQLLYILCFRFKNIEIALINVSICYLIVVNLPSVIAGFWVFYKDFKDCRPALSYVKKDSFKKIISIGSIFFMCQIAYMIITNTNEFFVSKYFGTQYAAEYSFYYRLTFLVSMMVSLAMTPIWSLVTKALEEKDFPWLCKLYRRIKKMALLIVVFQFVIIPFLQPLMNIWLGKDFIQVNYKTAFAFSCFGASFIYSSMLSTIVCGMARMKLQLYCYLIGIGLKFLIIDFFAVKYCGWDIIVWSNVIILFPYCIIQQIDLNRFFKKNETVI